jgi:hypothetical protein
MMSKREFSRMKPLSTVPLATLIGREIRNENVQKPFVKYGQAGLAKKGEDYFFIKTDCHRVPGDPSTAFSVFAVLFYFVVYLLVRFCIVEIILSDMVGLTYLSLWIHLLA